MSTPEQDQPDAQRAVDAVRAADPAAAAAPDLPRLHAALAESTGVQLADELAVRRARRTPRWIQVAAAVAGVAVVGVGSYALGAQHEQADPVAGGAAAPISLGEPTRELESAAASGAVPQAAADALGGKVATSLPFSGYGGHTVFTAKGLSTAGRSYDAWAYDAASVYSADTAARLADALGVSGKPQQDWGWTVGPNDGTGATVTLSPDGMASMSYYDPAKDPWACAKSAPDSFETPAADSDAASDGSVATDLGKAGSTCDPATAPSTKAALAEATSALTALGVDTGTLELETQDTGDSSTVSVVGYPVVGGQRTDAAWYVSVVADGVSSLNGPVAPLVALGSYDVVSPAQAVERLGDPRFGTSGGVIPYAAREGATFAAGDAAASGSSEEPSAPSVPPTLEPGSAIDWPVTKVTIDDARLGLATHTSADGSTALVPTYELTGTDGSAWSVIAIVDQQLDLASR
ncbi:MAG TPA: hypothetical protein VNR62_06770 [Cellulomonas sp.]|nr:hypothetical protein [Cellulomonas sp.]